MQNDRRLKYVWASLIAVSLPGVQAAIAAHPQAAKNFFLEPNSNSQPSFAGPQLSESELENRRIPDIRLLRTLPGLDPETRKKIDRLYKSWQTDTTELRNDIASLQRQISKLNSQNLPENGSKVESEAPGMAPGEAPVKPLAELKRQQKECRLELLNKRKELWAQIRPLLTEQNQQDLEKMRRGQFVPASVTASEGGK